MWKLENQMQREFSQFFAKTADYLFLPKNQLENRKKSREEASHYWITRVAANIIVALSPPKIRELYDWYSFLLEPGLFFLLRRWMDIETRPRKSILSESIGQPPPKRVAIFNTNFHGRMGYLDKRSEPSRKTWASIFGGKKIKN
jgi:hypothetical protein